MTMRSLQDSYASLYPQLVALGLGEWAGRLPEILAAAFDPARQGNLPSWLAAIENLPPIKPSQAELRERVAIGRPEDLAGFDRDILIRDLKALHPWRKGPFHFFGIDIDTEWRSDWKWDRLRLHIAPLAGRRVLDVGCGNGYHGWRMRGEGAAFVLGLDPVLLYVLQHQVLQRYLDDPHFHLLPLRMEELPGGAGCFDTVFSMGVLYHRRAPLDHLLELREALRPGGELVLETLVIEGDDQAIFTPPGRYAKMRNVWFIPSVAALELWLTRCGFTDVRCVDISRTTTGEQRATDWMVEESLADFLDPADPAKTIEGHPAPMRAILIANKG